MSNNTTIQEVESALYSIPPDLPREDWVKTGMAIKSEFGDAGFAPWDNWSQGGGSYNKKDAADVWKSIKPAVGGKSVGIGSLFMMAKDHGYKPAKKRTANTESVKKAKPTQTPDAAAKIDQSALAKAKERWDSATPVPSDFDHPYLKAKQVPAYGLRVDANGNLLTPMYQDGNFSCYQAISPVLGEKKPNAPGVSLNEAYFMMGDIASARRVFIAEGYATGATVHMVTGDPVAVSFGAGRLKLVAMDISRKYPGVQIVMAADDDAGGNSNPGLAAAQSAAETVGGSIAVPDFGGDRPEGASDFNDLMLSHGKEVVVRSLDSAKEVKKQSVSTGAELLPLPGYQFSDVSDDEVYNVEYIVKGVLHKGEVGFMFGDSGTMKSFVAADMMYHASLGMNWNGHRVKKDGTGVMVVLAEGQAGYRKRLRALRRKHGKDAPIWVVPEALDIVAHPEQLTYWVEQAELAMGVEVGVVLMDTFSLMMGDGDESSNKDVSKVLNAVRVAVKGRAILFVHHTGHGDKTRERGAYQIRGNADRRIHITRDDGGLGKVITVTCLKSKDDELFADFNVTYEVIELGHDQDGDKVTSLVIVPTDMEAVQPKNQKNGKPLDYVLDAVRVTGSNAKEVVKAHFMATYPSKNERTKSNAFRIGWEIFHTNLCRQADLAKQDI